MKKLLVFFVYLFIISAICYGDAIIKNDFLGFEVMSDLTPAQFSQVNGSASIDTCITPVQPITVSYSNSKILYGVHDSFVNDLPTIIYTGESGYEDDCIEPNILTSDGQVIYKINYSDPNGNAPLGGYPKVHILKDNVELPGSPFSMSYIAGDYVSGAIYQYAISLACGNNYSYFIEAYDSLVEYTNKITGIGPNIKSLVSGYVYDPNNNPMGSVTLTLSGDESISYNTDTDGYYQFWISTGQYYIEASSHAYYSFSPSSFSYYATQSNLFNQNFTRLNSAPGLSYTGESGYESDSLDYETATPTMTLTFRIKYFDVERDCPLSNYPKLHVYKEGSLYYSQIMEYLSGDFSSGAIYSASASFPDISADYSYNFTVYDKYNAYYSWSDGFRFTIFSNSPTEPVIVPDPDNPEFYDGGTVVSSEIRLCWISTEPDNEKITYTLYLSEPDNNRLSPAAVKNTGILYPVYTGYEPSYTIRNLTPGRQYLWQVKAADIHGASSVSDVFSFFTLDLEDKEIFNYPNPFNPLEEYTTFVFKSSELQTVKFYVYSEFADLVYQEDIEALPGTNSFRYNGRDNSGNVLYNGSYIARIEKNDGVGTCYILIIK